MNVQENVEKSLHGIINVPLAIFWIKPGEGQVYKEISQQAALDTAAWAEDLSVEERLWLVGKVNTTALYGETVVILGKQGEWVHVAATSQQTAQNKLGYPGWVLANQICPEPHAANSRPNLKEAVIAIPKAHLFIDSGLSVSRGLLSYQTRLPIFNETETYYQVRLADGTSGFLNRSSVKKNDELCFDSQAIIREAHQFLGLAYLWGGTSSLGFDCSGLMFRLYQSQGLSIPRDASEQAGGGIPVARENLHPGDLLFFAQDKLQGKIHHVGMYIGEGLMIHSPNSKSVIRIEPFEAGIYGEEYWGAKRYPT